MVRGLLSGRDVASPGKRCCSREDASEGHSLLPPSRFLLVAPVTGSLQKPEGKETSMVIWDTELGRERQRWNCAGTGLWKGGGGWGISSTETSLSFTLLEQFLTFHRGVPSH